MLMMILLEIYFLVLIIFSHPILIIAKIIFLILGEEDTFGINKSFGAPEKNFSINFSKARTIFCLGFHYDGDNSYLFVNGKKPFQLKANNNNANFPNQFCLRCIYSIFDCIEVQEVFLK